MGKSSEKRKKLQVNADFLNYQCMYMYESVHLQEGKNNVKDTHLGHTRLIYKLVQNISVKQEMLKNFPSPHR